MLLTAAMTVRIGPGIQPYASYLALQVEAVERVARPLS